MILSLVCTQLTFALLLRQPQGTAETPSPYLEYRTWSGQHWRVKAESTSKIIDQHMPDEKKVSEERTVGSFQYKTGGGAKYTASIEEQVEKGVKRVILRHVSENGKDNHLDTHISFLGWDNAAHRAEVTLKDGAIVWVTLGTAAATTKVDPVTGKPTPAPKPSPAKTEPPKKKSDG